MERINQTLSRLFRIETELPERSVSRYERQLEYFSRVQLQGFNHFNRALKEDAPSEELGWIRDTIDKAFLENERLTKRGPRQRREVVLFNSKRIGL